MVRLLSAQKDLVYTRAKLDEDEAYEFALFFLEMVLEIYPSNLDPNEDREIRNCANEWCKGRRNID
jgi:hypothetical protein